MRDFDVPNVNNKRLERNIGLFVLALLLLGCLIVMWPFVSAFLWAVVLCFTTWPVYTRVLKWVGHRPTIAALIMLLAMVLIILMPFVLIGFTLANNVSELTAATRNWLSAGTPPPPEWLAKVPFVGERATDYWQSLAEDSSKLLELFNRLIEPASRWLLKMGLALGQGLLQLALSIFIAFFLFRDGLTAANRLTAAIERIGGKRGMHLLTVAGNTVRSVVNGILGTALAQAVIAGVGFTIAGVPGPGVLALFTFFLSPLPVGPPLVWIPASVWLFYQGSIGWGIFMLIWGIGVSSVDNVIKPWLISRGSTLPFILILFGVLGGAIAFGFIGVFLGPTLLTVGVRVIEEWISGKHAPAAETGESAAPEK
jgi:predicted PurR-regulated permease PerM